MGKRKGGKKAWKKIDTQDVTDFIERQTREERQGLADVDKVPDADLFFVDKTGDEEAAAATAAKPGRLSRKLSARQKLLRAQVILQSAHAAKPAAKPMVRKPKGSVLEQQQRAKQQQTGAAAAGSKAGRGLKASSGTEAATLDIWDAPEEHGDGWTDALQPAKRQRRSRGPASSRAVVPTAAAAAALAAGKGREVKSLPVPAVEIDPAGCSYNPDPELHQEAVAAAVAAETRQLLDKELEPVAPPRVVDYEPERDELALLQTLEGGEGGPEQQGQPDEEPGDDEDPGAIEAARRKLEAERKTRKDKNRERRRREAEEQLEEQRKLKAQRRELSSLKEIEKELQAEEEEKEAARLRRQLDKAERLAAAPPKLSKHKFQPMPMQVLTSDELAGSLRRLKPTAMLAKDRFKSFQKRALIEPRRKIEQKKQGKKVEYVHGERAEKAAERQQELAELRKSRGKAAGKR